MKKLFILFILVFTTITLSGCTGKRINKSEDTNLEFWITERVDDVDFSVYQQKYGWMGATEYYGKNYIPLIDENNEQIDPTYCVKYLVTNYPDCSSNHKAVTRITITDPTITFYGLSLTSTKDEITKKMGENNYKIEIINNLVIATKKNVSFSFSEKQITINTSVTNIFRIQY